MATFLGGIRSLLLQSLHPLALAGVDRHSSYRQDPFGRLQRTGAFIAATTYGSETLAAQTVAAVRSMHTRVAGSTADGRRYSAEDPRLLRWVHIALVDSMLTSYVRFGHNGAVEADAYVADMALVGERMGVVEPPRTAAELAADLEGFRPELQRSGDTVRMKRFVMSPPLPVGLRPGYAVLARAAIDTLPDWSVEMLGSRPVGPVSRVARGWAADLSLRTLSFALVKSPAQAAGEQRLAGVVA